MILIHYTHGILWISMYILSRGSRISRFCLIARSYGSSFLNTDFLRSCGSWFSYFPFCQAIVYLLVSLGYQTIKFLICGGILWIMNLELWFCRRVLWILDSKFDFLLLEVVVLGSWTLILSSDFGDQMFSIASVTRIYLLHILKLSIMPILKCIWGHLRGPDSASTLKFAKFPEPQSLLSKLQNCRTELIVRSFESFWWDKDTSNVPKLSFLYFQSYSRNRNNRHGHFVFFCLYFSKYWK